MLKAKRILYDLKHNLKGKKRVFNYYDVEHNVRESKNLEISVLDIIRALQPYEIDFKGLYKVDFDDVVYEDKEGNYYSLELDIKSDNSYNWNSQIVFNFNTIKLTDNWGINHEYITIKFHRYGDVRGNYTDYMVLNMDLNQFYEVLMDSSRVYCEIKLNNELYEISTDCFKEDCLFDIYSNEGGIDDYDTCLNIDNLRSKKDIKKALKQYLKENYAA